MWNGCTWNEYKFYRRCLLKLSERNNYKWFSLLKKYFLKFKNKKIDYHCIYCSSIKFIQLKQ